MHESQLGFIFASNPTGELQAQTDTDDSVLKTKPY